MGYIAVSGNRARRAEKRTRTIQLDLSTASESSEDEDDLLSPAGSMSEILQAVAGLQRPTLGI